MALSLQLPHLLLYSPHLLLLTSVIALSSLLLLFFTRKPPPGDHGHRSMPPGPRGLPLLGHLPLLGALPHRTLRSLAAVHGPVMLLRFGRVPTVVVSSAAAAQEVMKTRDLAFASRPRTLMAERLLYGRDVAFSPYGEYWRQIRRICVLHLLSLHRIHSFRGLREQEARAMVEKVNASAGSAVNLSELLISYTNSVISRATFGDGAYGFGGEGKRIKAVFSDFEGLLGTAPMAEFVPWLGCVDRVTGLEARVRRTFEVMDGILEKVIEDHRRRRRGRRPNGDGGNGENDHRDFVDVLLDVNETDKEARVRLDTAEIKAIILDMFAAGTDTSYTVMEWAMAELINHPYEMNRLQEEVRKVVGSDKHVTEDHLAKMDYLKAVIKETVRLHTPIPLLVPRETLEDTKLSGYHIPARTRVVINAWAIAADPELWERPEEFWPERFVDSSVDYRGQDFELIPFGAGRRRCPGIGFAIPTMELGVASLLYHFDWELPNGRTPGSLDMSEVNGLSIRLKSGLLLVAKPWLR